jgi:drug/metabolite transporter (DMT)-like permease
MNDRRLTSASPQPPLTQILLAFAGIYIVWGTTFVALAIVIRTIPPFISGALRFALAGGLMYAWLRAREPRPFSGLNIGGCILVGVLMSGIGNGFVIWSQQGLPSGIAALFVGALPVSTLILDWLFFSRRAPSSQSALGVAIGLAGIVVLTSHTHSFSGTIRPLHVISVLTAELGWSAGTLLQRRYVSAARVMNFVCLQMLAGGGLPGGVRQPGGGQLLFIPGCARAGTESDHVCAGEPGDRPRPGRRRARREHHAGRDTLGDPGAGRSGPGAVPAQRARAAAPFRRPRTCARAPLTAIKRAFRQ